jgi:hypothetical protein
VLSNWKRKSESGNKLEWDICVWNELGKLRSLFWGAGVSYVIVMSSVSAEAQLRADVCGL